MTKTDKSYDIFAIMTYLDQECEYGLNYYFFLQNLITRVELITRVFSFTKLFFQSDTHDFNSRVIIREGQTLKFFMEATFPLTLSWCYDAPKDKCRPAVTFRVTNKDDLHSSGCSFILSPFLDPRRNSLTISPSSTIATRKPQIGRAHV